MFHDNCSKLTIYCTHAHLGSGAQQSAQMRLSLLIIRSLSFFHLPVIQIRTNYDLRQENIS